MRRGHVRSKASAIRSTAEMFVEVEEKKGVVDPVIVMVLIRAYRTLEATNRAQRELIRKLGAELTEVKKKCKTGRVGK